MGSGGVDRRDIERGATWSFVALAGKQFGRIIFSLLLARLLGPLNYGIVGQATIYILLTRFLLDQGFGTALVQKSVLHPRDVGSVLWINLVSVAALVGLTIALSEPSASFLNTPELGQVLRVLSIDVALMGFSVVPTALLTRHLRFKALAVAEILSTLVGGLAGVVFALSGGEYWSLVLFTLVTDGVYLLVVLVVEPPRHLQASWEALRGLWRFGIRVMGSQILYYVARNADNLIIAKLLGAAALGLYALAYRVLMLPQQMLGQVINRVTLPVFSRAQDDPRRVRSLFGDIAAALALLTFPGFGLIVVAAPDLMPLAFGERWSPAVATMQILAVAGWTMTPAHLARPVLFAFDAPGTVLKVQIAATVASLVGFLIGVRWGIEGVAIAVVVVNAVFGPLLLALACRRIELSVIGYLRRMWPASAATAIAAAAYLAGVAVLGDGNVAVMACTAGAVVVYVAALQLFWPTEVAFSRQLVIRLLGSKKGEAGHRNYASTANPKDSTADS